MFNKGITFALLRELRNYVTARGAVLRVGFTSGDAELEHCLKSLGIPCVDLTTDLVLEGDWHWSPAGNAFVAERIDQFLRSDGRFDLNE